MSATRPTQTRRGVVFFAHGARDPRWSEPLIRLVQSTQQRLPRAYIVASFLELQAPSLDAALDDAAANRCTEIDVVPIFWAAAGHVANEIPAIIDAFRARQPGLTVRLLPTLSELPGLLDFIADAVAGHSPPAQSPRA